MSHYLHSHILVGIEELNGRVHLLVMRWAFFGQIAAFIKLQWCHLAKTLESIVPFINPN